MELISDSEEARQIGKEKLIKAKKHVNTALINLKVAVNPLTWGNNDHVEGFNDMLKQYIKDLEEIKLKLAEIAHKIC